VVYDRAILNRTVYEHAVDFALAVANDEVWIDVAEARLMDPSGSQINLGKHVVHVGDYVEVVGWKSRTMDPLLPRLDREEPTRVVLRSGRSLPLLIIPSVGPARPQLPG
jgi:hypothetical protein